MILLFNLLTKFRIELSVLAFVVNFQVIVQVKARCKGDVLRSKDIGKESEHAQRDSNK